MAAYFHKPTYHQASPSPLQAPMANTPPSTSPLTLVCALFFFPFLSFAISPCNGPCRTSDDCEGRLICVSHKCDDDPDLGTHTCDGVPSPPPPSGHCQSSGTVQCGDVSYPIYTCSPQITSPTTAILSNSEFSGPLECEGEAHKNSDLVVALSTGWYNGGFMCGKTIKIMADNGRNVVAKVVDECDSARGCGKESPEPPCGNNNVVGSDGVWSALGLGKEVGSVNVTWAEAMDVQCDPNNYMVHIM